MQSNNKIKMHHWQQKKRQRVHHNMIEHAKPTIKRYSGSREKITLNTSRTKPITNNINLPFKQVLGIFQLQRYEELLNQFGFPQRIKDKESVSYIDDMLKRVDEEDQDKFLSLMSALLSISTDFKSRTVKRTPMIKRSQQKHLPPTHNSTHLKKCDSIVTKKNDKMPNFRIKSKEHMRRPSNDTPSKFTEKSTVPKRSKARDDSVIVHEFRLKGPSQVKFADKLGLIERLQQKLRKLKGVSQSNQNEFGEANLHYKQIKEMYLSYDTATLTSNISNIDIEQIIDCFAIEVEQMIVEMPLRSTMNPELIKKKSKKHKIQQLLKQSLVESNNLNNRQVQAEMREELDSQMDYAESIGSSDDLNTQMEESQTLFDFEHLSIAYDLSCFNYQYQDQTLGACTRKDIKNFIQLVMMAGKMEKQTPIISFVYIKRVLSICKKDKISSRNWKNLILVTLIEASKIWDDQSLQNHSFSKVIKPYTTLQINRLERHLLNLLNYSLKIDPKEYCLSYFTLRKHINEASKTAHQMPLDLLTIRKLQTGTKKCERSMKQTYKKKLNESF